MNNVMIFEGSNVEIMKDENGHPLFELYSVGMALGQTKTAKGKIYPRKERIDKTIENAEIATVVHNGQQYLTEEMLYDFMLEAKTDKCKSFRKWLTTEVLPSIRKHGAYMTDSVLEQAISNPDMMIGLLQNLKAEQQKRKLEEEKRIIAEQKAQEKQVVIDTVINDNGIYSIGVVGKILKSYCGEMGAKKTFSYLRNEGILMEAPNTQRHNLPYDIFSKYFEVKYTTKDFKTFPITYFNGKGVKWFLERLVKRGLLTPREREEAKSKIG